MLIAACLLKASGGIDGLPQAGTQLHRMGRLTPGGPEDIEACVCRNVQLQRVRFDRISGQFLQVCSSLCQFPSLNLFHHVVLYHVAYVKTTCALASITCLLAVCRSNILMILAQAASWLHCCSTSAI